jgi:(R,R)-butanediol dehydrogenase / meso-butanediol dehydrogenase / diacetyl reductase
VRAQRYHGREDLRLEDVAEPTAGPGEVKLRVLLNGICGSDLHEFSSGPIMCSVRPHPLTGASMPSILGHELCGEVTELGDDVDDLVAGQLVAVEPVQTCGACVHCRSGRRNLCQLMAMHGYQRDGGGLAEYTVLRRDMVHVAPVGLSAHHVALTEPMAVAWHGVRRAGVQPGDVVSVHGGGPIGIGVLLAARAQGCRVIVFEPSPERADVLVGLGAEHVGDPAVVDAREVVLDLTAGAGATASFDAAGVAASLDAATRCVGPGGVTVVLGLHLEPVALQLQRMLLKETSIVGSRAYVAGDFAAVLGAMAGGGYPLDGWVTTIGFDDVVEEGIAALRARRATKVLVDVAARWTGPGEAARPPA